MISLSENTLRIQPPLTIKPENLKKGFQIVDEAINEYINGQISDDVLNFKKGW